MCNLRVYIQPRAISQANDNPEPPTAKKRTILRCTGGLTLRPVGKAWLMVQLASIFCQSFRSQRILGIYKRGTIVETRKISQSTWINISIEMHSTKASIQIWCWEINTKRWRNCAERSTSYNWCSRISASFLSRSIKRSAKGDWMILKSQRNKQTTKAPQLNSLSWKILVTTTFTDQT